MMTEEPIRDAVSNVIRYEWSSSLLLFLLLLPISRYIELSVTSECSLCLESFEFPSNNKAKYLKSESLQLEVWLLHTTWKNSAIQRYHCHPIRLALAYYSVSMDSHRPNRLTLYSLSAVTGLPGR